MYVNVDYGCRCMRKAEVRLQETTQAWWRSSFPMRALMPWAVWETSRPGAASPRWRGEQKLVRWIGLRQQRQWHHHFPEKQSQRCSSKEKRRWRKRRPSSWTWMSCSPRTSSGTSTVVRLFSRCSDSFVQAMRQHLVIALLLIPMASADWSMDQHKGLNGRRWCFPRQLALTTCGLDCSCVSAVTKMRAAVHFLQKDRFECVAFWCSFKVMHCPETNSNTVL